MEQFFKTPGDATGGQFFKLEAQHVQVVSTYDKFPCIERMDKRPSSLEGMTLLPSTEREFTAAADIAFRKMGWNAVVLGHSSPLPAPAKAI